MDKFTSIGGLTRVMRELAVDALPTLVYTVATGALAVLGSIAEYTSLQYVGTGETMVAVWLAVFGAILLYAGLSIGRHKLLASVAA